MKKCYFIFLSFILLTTTCAFAQWTSPGSVTYQTNSTDDVFIGGSLNYNAGTKLVWDYGRRALKGGFHNTGYWDPDSLGISSFAFGNHLITTSQYSYSLGTSNEVRNGFAAGALGSQNDNHGGAGSIIIGSSNYNSGGAGSIVLGTANNNSGGQASIALGSYNIVTGDSAATAIGQRNKVNSMKGIAIGQANEITPFSWNAMAIGHRTKASATDAYVIGSGSSTQKLENPIAHSIMLGVNSSSPAIFINGWNGVNGAIGNVGIGTTFASEKLSVDGAVKIGNSLTNTIGTIRWNGTNFQGYNGTAWNNFEGSGGGAYTSAAGATIINSNTDNVVIAGNETTIGNKAFWDQIKGAARFGNGPSVSWNAANVGANSFAAGSYNIASATAAIAMGASNNASGLGSIALGTGNVNTGARSVSLGNNNLASGGNSSIAIGTNNKAIGNGSIAVGYNTKAQAYNSIAIGSGSVFTELTNNIPGSMMVGFNSDIPTFFVGPALVDGTTGKVGIGTSTPTHDLHVAGDIAVAGQIVHPSDRNLKENITTITNGLSTINQLSPKSYTHKTNEAEEFGLSTKPQFGLIAQEVQKVLPQIVVDEALIAQDGTTYMGLDYEKLIPVLVAALQEAHQEIETLKANDNAQAAINKKLLDHMESQQSSK